MKESTRHPSLVHVHQAIWCTFGARRGDGFYALHQRFHSWKEASVQGRLQVQGQGRRVASDSSHAKGPRHLRGKARARGDEDRARGGARAQGGGRQGNHDSGRVPRELHIRPRQVPLARALHHQRLPLLRQERLQRPRQDPPLGAKRCPGEGVGGKASQGRPLGHHGTQGPRPAQERLRAGRPGRPHPQEPALRREASQGGGPHAQRPQRAHEARAPHVPRRCRGHPLQPRRTHGALHRNARGRALRPQVGRRGPQEPHPLGEEVRGARQRKVLRQASQDAHERARHPPHDRPCGEAEG